MKTSVKLGLTALAAILILAGSIAVSLISLPDVGTLDTCFTTAMYEVNLCPGSSDYVKLRDVSPFVLHAVIAAEDGSFYSHGGFDWFELKQSFSTDLKKGQFHRGGSTLTQQLAKNVFLGKEKSVWRKAKEAYLAYGIEKRFPKNFILEKYLNVVEFGENIYGIKPAAKFYFRKSPADLNPLEAAWLAMLLPSPKKYSQSFRKGTLTPYARRMVSTILKRMTSFGKLTAAAYNIALEHLDEFPWQSVSLAQFSGRPDYNLESTPTAQSPIDDSQTVEGSPPDEEPQNGED